MHNKKSNLKGFLVGFTAIASVFTISSLNVKGVFAEEPTYKLYDEDDTGTGTQSNTTNPYLNTSTQATSPPETESTTKSSSTPTTSINNTSTTESNVTSSDSDNSATSNGSSAYADLTWPTAPNLVSKQAILMDADTGAILYEKNAYKRNYPASTTKILTGLLVARNAALSETVTFSKKAADSVEDGDATLSIKAGEQLSVEQALSGLLLYSANEIAYGLAEHVSGSLDAFVDQMNEEAKKAGALDTHFANASGLYDANHYSTPYDMALIARTCFNNPTFLQIDSQETYTIPPTNMTNEPRTFSNRNKLLPGLDYGYAYCVGGKTGYLPEGGYTYVSYAEKDGQRLIAVCFDSTSDDRFFDAETLFNWGYKNFSKVPLSRTTIADPYSASSYLNPTRFSSGKLVRAFDASYVTLPNNADISDVKLSKDDKHSSEASSSNVTIPVLFTYGNHTVGSANLTYTASDSASGISNLLPLESKSSATGYKVNKALVVDLRFLIVLGIIGIVVFIVVTRKRQHEERQKEINRKRERRKRN